MFDPKINYTDKLVSNLIKIEHHKTTIQKTELSYNVKQKLNSYNKASDILHIAHILGVELTLKDAEKILISRKVEGLDDERAYMITNFRNTLEFNRSNIAATYGEMDRAALLHINKLIVTNWRESWDARFRNVQETIDERWDNFAPLRDMQADTPRENEVSDLIEWYKNVTPTMPEIVRIGVAIFRLIEICPFLAGNKITLVGFTDYLLYKNGLSGKSFVSIARNFDLNDEEYIEAYKLSRQNYDLTYWLEVFSRKIMKDLLDAREEINKFLLEDEKAKKQPFLDLNKRQLKILKYLQTVPVIQREDYCHMMDVSTMTAFRDLNDLVRKKLIKIDGKGRGTKYRLSTM